MRCKIEKIVMSNISGVVLKRKMMAKRIINIISMVENWVHQETKRKMGRRKNS